MNHLSPAAVMQEVSAAVPIEFRERIVVIGSLAAGYHFFRDEHTASVRTKDIDCVLEPFVAAVEAGRHIARGLLDAGWQLKLTGQHAVPGDENTPDDALPAVRLYPPNIEPESEGAWFIELLTVPPANSSAPRWTRMQINEGHFGLPSFRFLTLAAYEPLFAEDLGLRYARPQMLALANLLEHPKIEESRMSALISQRAIKRSNKDLGRVVAIAMLSNPDDFRSWAYDWLKALQTCFPHEWRPLGLRAGTGLRSLLESPNDLEEAHHTCLYGLMSSQPPALEAYSVAGERLLVDAVEGLESMIRAYPAGE